MKKLTFKRLLAGEYDDARHVTLKVDEKLLKEMRSIGWWPYSRPLYKNNRGIGRPDYMEGSTEWKKDIRIALTNLSRM